MRKATSTLAAISIVPGSTAVSAVASNAAAAIRACGYWVSGILLLGFAWIAVDERSQGFHDKFAGTFVVYDWAKRPTLRRGA